ncbi:MAG: hypothetical protein HY290_21535 [Planctomycetia bacterium]|nr:hypothetical protein [Planctomycetia bacterium]
MTRLFERSARSKRRCAMIRNNLAMAAMLLLVLPAATKSDEPTASPDEAGHARRASAMQRSAAQFTIRLRDESERPLKLVTKPIQRWANPENAAKDGTIYLWTDRGRPAVALGLFTYDDDHFSHEWQSLTASSLTASHAAGTEWTTSEPGISFEKLEKVDPPAAAPAARLRQMKALAGRFTATYVGFSENQNPLELRLLPQPLYRYESSEIPELVDGGIFAFVQGTDPQLLLIVEAWKAASGEHWQFACARSASGAVAAKYEGREVFSVPKYDFQHDPRKPFLLLPRQPAPEE